MVKVDKDSDWGKFQKIDRPLQVWEPSDQSTILEVANEFLSHPHSAGYAYAINIDPVQFSLYVGNASNEAWYIQLIPEASNPQIALFPKGNLWENGVEYFLFYYKGLYFLQIKLVFLEDGKNYYEQFENSGIRGEVNKEEWNSVKQQEILWTNGTFVTTSKIVTKEKSYLLIQSYTEYGLYEFNGTGIKLLGSHNLTREGQQLTLISLQNQGIAAISTTPINNFFNFSQILISIQNGSFIQENQIEQLRFSDDIDTFQLTYLQTNAQGIEEFMLIYHSLEDNIKQFKISMDTENFITEKFVGNMIGQGFSSSLLKDVMFQIVYGGHCFNNEEANKNPDIQLCDDEITPHAFILNYFIFHPENREITNQTSENSIINACWQKEGIVGTTGVGNHAVVDGYYEQGQRAAFVQVFEGWSGQLDSIDLSYCGVSQLFNGIVLNSFVLPEQYSPEIKQYKHKLKQKEAKEL